MSAAGPLLDTFSAASLHCRVHPDTYRSAVELTGRIDELRGGRS
jgi:hypothetical protein